MATIYLIRHGQASFGSDNYDCLSPLGREQASAAGTYFKRCGIHFDASYSGDLQRQRDTAALACAEQNADHLPHHIDARLNEIDNEAQMLQLLPKLLQQQPQLQPLVDKIRNDSKSYQKILQRVFNAWVDGDNGDSLQSWQDYRDNAHGALKDIMTQQGGGKTVAVFTSGGTIATLVSCVLGLQGEQIYAFYEPVVNCSITTLFYSNDRVSVSCYNDHSFLNMLAQEQGKSLVTYR